MKEEKKPQKNWGVCWAPQKYIKLGQQDIT